MRKAFTIVELLVAMGLFGMLLAASGVIFATAVNAHRTAEATAEISQKLAAITDQLNADFRGLRKEGEIFAVWVARPVDDDDKVVPYNSLNIAGFQRFDRIMFFADGDFQTYQEQRVDDGTGNPDFQILTGNVARICYMLARDGSDAEAYQQEPPARILSRTQHIFTSEDMLDEDGNPSYFPLLASFDPCEFEVKNFTYEYDTTTMQEWKNIALGDKYDMLSVISGIDVGGGTGIGTPVSASDPTTIHMLLCQGVGQFSVQGWYDPQQRWVPDLIWDEDGQILESDFFVDVVPGRIDPCEIPGVLYSPPFGIILMRFDFQGGSIPPFLDPFMNEANFNFIPGLGRAFKFTFTLYDSKGVFPEGKTFTHIVYLDD
ncbi:MAG: PilW family protein [Planctomycetota bacterium]|jgi:prepilin-type N-terminal cleavage/methylation domain-containing protein